MQITKKIRNERGREVDFVVTAVTTDLPWVRIRAISPNSACDNHWTRQEAETIRDMLTDILAATEKYQPNVCGETVRS